MTSYKSGLRFLCIQLVLVLLIAGCSGVPSNNKVKAVRGVFNLGAAELEPDHAVSLSGEWEFYWNRFLNPEDFRSGTRQRPTGYLNVPEPWHLYKVNGTNLSRRGHATYRLKILPGNHHGRFTLRLYDIHEAYRLWADGRLIASRGIVGTSENTEVASRALDIIDIDLGSSPTELVLQVSNYHFRHGGITEHVFLAKPGLLETIRARDWGLSLFFAGSIFIMGIYHLVMFYWRRKDKAPLYFGLYCFLVVGYSITSNTSFWVASAIFPSWNHSNMEAFSLTCFILWASLIFRFLKTLYPEEMHSFLLLFIDVRIPVFIILLIFGSSYSMYWFIAVCLLETFALSVYYMQRLFVCFRRKRTGAMLILIGAFFQFIAGINDPLAHAGVIKSVYLVEPAVFFFVLAQSLVLSKRFSAAFTKVESLSVELEKKNISLHNEIDERNRLEKKIIEVSEEERRQLSHELHDSLCQMITGARLRASALAHMNAEKKVGPPLSELEHLLRESTQEAYRIARGLYPVEHAASGLTLENLVNTISETTDINAKIVKDFYCDNCTSPNSIPLYRIAQESLANAVKHSKAENVTVELECRGDGRLSLLVKDDGVGFDLLNNGSDFGGLGMEMMRHRAKIIGASLQFESASGKGTRVICSVSCGVVDKVKKND